MRQLFWFILIPPLVMVNGCSTTTGPAPVEDRAVSGMQGMEESPGVVVETMPTDDQGTHPGEKIEPPDSSANPAVVALLSQADKDIGAGREDGAAATVERALHLAPKDAYLWYRLAEIKLRQSNWQQAYVLASKSNSLAAGNKPLLMANWRIIALAKKKQGDKSGMELAAKEIEKLKQQ